MRSGLVCTDGSDFIKEYQLDCPYAMDRLVKYGVPATVLHRQVDERDQIGRARQAAETVRGAERGRGGALLHVSSQPPSAASQTITNIFHVARSIRSFVAEIVTPALMEIVQLWMPDCCCG